MYLSNLIKPLAVLHMIVCVVCVWAEVIDKGE